MLEFTGIGTVLRGIGYLYWAIGIGLLWLALWKGKGWIGKALWALPVLGVWGYLPVTGYIEYQKRMAFSDEAWAYFKNLCDTKSGQKIYKTFTGVKSVLIVKPLPSATGEDLSDQFWYGDPYSDGAKGGDRSGYFASQLARRPVPDTSAFVGFDFVEYLSDREGVRRIFRFSRRMDLPLNDPQSGQVVEIAKPESRIALAWEDISTPGDRKFWVAGSRLSVVDLNDNTVVAERIGYFIYRAFGPIDRASPPWLTTRGPSTTCPPVMTTEHDDRTFIFKTLNSIQEK